MIILSETGSSSCLTTNSSFGLLHSDMKIGPTFSLELCQLVGDLVGAEKGFKGIKFFQKIEEGKEDTLFIRSTILLGKLSPNLKSDIAFLVADMIPTVDTEHFSVTVRRCNQCCDSFLQTKHVPSFTLPARIVLNNIERRQ